ncbi:MAG: sulfatase [Verrucomicrobiota bacterium]
MNLRCPFRASVLLLFLSNVCFFPTLCAEESVSRPNILMLIGDDIDRDSLGPWGGQAITPHLDQLAAEGVRLDRVYANVAMCAPFRQELYSGRTAWRTRAIPNHSKSLPETRSLPHYLEPLGYRVALLGKSHVGPPECYPFERLGDFTKKEDGNPVVMERATTYIRESVAAEEPFCLIIAAHDGHSPYTTGDPSAYPIEDLEIPEDALGTRPYRENLAAHLAEVTNLDVLLGKLRQLLAEEKLTEDTLVIYCAEQGNAFPFGKWTCFDDGLGSGIVAAWPGVIPAGTVSSALTWIADFTPTLIEAAGGEINQDDFDGKSQWANLTGGDEVIHEYAYGAFTNCNIIDNRERVFPIRSIRDTRFTLIWSPLGAEGLTSNTTLSGALEWLETGTKPDKIDSAASWVARSIDPGKPRHKTLVERLHHRPVWALYDRESDPEELNNLIDDPAHAETVARMKAALSEWLSKWDDADPVETEKGFVGMKKKN